MGSLLIPLHIHLKHTHFVFLFFFFWHHPLLQEKLGDYTVYMCLFLGGKMSLKEEKVLWKALLFCMNVTSCCMNMSSG